MKSIDMLRELREQGGKVRTHGLDDATVERFAGQDADLAGIDFGGVDDGDAVRRAIGIGRGDTSV